MKHINTSDFGKFLERSDDSQYLPVEETSCVRNILTQVLTLCTMANASEDFPVLEICDHDHIDRCHADLGWKYLIISISILSVAINIFHIVVTSKLSSLKGSAYLFILRQISITDIYSSVLAFSLICPVHELYLGKDIRLAAIFATIQGHAGQVRLAVLAAASYERFQSICTPLASASLYCCGEPWGKLQKTKCFTTLLWVVSFIVPFIKNYFFKENLCLWALFGPAIMGQPKSGLVVLLYLIVLTAIIVICNGKALRELRLVDNRNRGICDSLSTKRATKYIIIINVAYYLCLIPAYTLVILMSFGVIIIPARWAVHLLYSLYGIFNVVIYGWIMKPYREVAKQMFRFGKVTVSCLSANKSAAGERSTASGRSTCKQSSDNKVELTTQGEAGSSAFIVAYSKPDQIDNGIVTTDVAGYLFGVEDVPGHINAGFKCDDEK